MNQGKSSLLGVLTGYVPRFVVRQILVAPCSYPAGYEERIEVALLFADISGFTAMSESLAQLGKEGAEELTRVLNEYFTTMIDVVECYGGDVIKFGGDAITCMFATHKGHDLHSALSCAVMMQEKMADFQAVETRGGVFRLQMKIGISAGRVLSMIAGDPGIGLEYVLAGRPLDRMADAEHHASAGEVVVGSECLEELQGIITGYQRDGFTVVSRLTRPAAGVAAERLDWDTFDNETADQLLARLMPFLPPTVYERIMEGQRQFVAEQRRVVSLFVNFFGLDYDDDPAAGQKLQSYYLAMQEIVHRYGGRLNRVITGDKGSLLHIIFGAPVAHEDDEERAIGCALAMQDYIGKSRALPFIADQRIGIASGYVFAGTVGSERRLEYTIMGDVVNLSARLMQAAAPGEIIADRRTAQKAGRGFVCEELTPIRVKGKQAPVHICRPVGPREETRAPWRLMAQARRQTLPIVGREEELAHGEAIVHRAATGHGQLLIVTGEAGVGKTRLLEELIALAYKKVPGTYCLGGNCLSYGSQVPYLPWIDFLTSYFGLRAEGGADESDKIRLVERRMAEADPALAGWTPLLGQLLGLPAPDNELTAVLDGQLRKQRIFDIMLTLVRHQALQSPLFIMVFEDVHWIDAISLELLNYIARNIARHRILLIALHRPTIELTEWQKYEYCNRIALADLSAGDAIRLVQLKLGTAEIPEALKERVLRGEERVNAFFVEELLNSLLERGYLVPRTSGEGYEVAEGLERAEIPDSIQALVMSRIDRLDESSKLTVKVASVIGQTFKYRALHGIYPVEVSEERLQKNLERLSALDVIPLDQPASEPEYIFKHIVTQEVAYDSLLFTHRRELHRRFGEYMERTYAGKLEEYYGLLAYHYTRSGDLKKSWEYLVKAGDQARDRYANEAAIAYYTQALSIEGVPDDEIASVQESLGSVYQHVGQYDQALKWYEAAGHHPLPPVHAATLKQRIAKTWELQGRYDEAMRYLDLARVVLEGLEAAPELARVYGDMGWVAMRRGEYEKAIEWCNKGLEIAARMRDDAEGQNVRARLEHTLGTIYSQKGEYAQASVHLLSCIAMQEKSGDLYWLSQSYNNLAAVYWGQGDYDEAAHYLSESLRVSQRIGHTYGTAMCYNNLGVIYYTLGDYLRAVEYYNQSLTLRQQIGDLLGIADVYNNLGEVHYTLGAYAQALDYLEEAVRLFTEIGNKTALFDACKLLAETRLALGDLVGAAIQAEQSLELAREIGNREYEGIAHRVSGQVRRAGGQTDESCRELRTSVGILRETANRLELGKSYYELGLTLTASGDAEGRRALQQAAEIFQELGVEKELKMARAALGSAST